MFKLFRNAAAFIAALAVNGVAGEGSDRSGEHGEWESFDRARFPYSKWLPGRGRETEAVVICVHGLSGAASDFEQLGGELARRGLAVYAYELRGQGKDPKRRRVGDLRKREHWFRDLDRFIAVARHDHPRAPVFLYGESLGALIVMHGWPAISKQSRDSVRGLVYASPVVALPGELPPFKNFLVRTMMKICPRFKVSLRKLSGGKAADVSEDGDHWEQMENTEHFVPRMSLRLLGTIEAMVKGSAAAAPPIDRPVLVVYPGEDVFTPPEKVEAFFDGLAARDKTRRQFAESRHLLMFDKQREELFETVGDWIAKRK